MHHLCNRIIFQKIQTSTYDGNSPHPPSSKIRPQSKIKAKTLELFQHPEVQITQVLLKWLCKRWSELQEMETCTIPGS